MSDSPDSLELRIRERAHLLWEKESHPHGRSEEFWYRAQSEIDAEDNAHRVPIAPPPSETGVDLHSEQSFPASDPPPHNVIVGPST